MQLEELFEKYSKAADAIRESYTEILLNSLDNVEDEDAKEFAKSIFNDEYIISFIENSPRSTFDFFDNNNIFIQISVDLENNCFRYSFDGGKVESNDYSTRKEAEVGAVEKAFEILNEKL